MCLIVTHGPNLGYQYPLTEEEATIGRSTSNDIVLPSPEISRKHARIWKEGEATFLEDLGSTNGTYVNNKRVSTAVAIRDGDEIQIGDSFRLLYACQDEAEKSVAAVQGTEQQQLISAAAATSLTQFAETSAASEIPTPRPPLFTDLEIQQSEASEQQSRLLLLLGCASLLLLSLCLATVFILDSYQNGRLLYCGGFNGIFRFVLGPFGFNPVCP